MGVVLKEEDIAFIKEHFSNADVLLSADNYKQILDALFALSAKEGYDDYYPNALGEEIDVVYQRILYNNSNHEDEDE